MAKKNKAKTKKPKSSDEENVRILDLPQSLIEVDEGPASRVMGGSMDDRFNLHILNDVTRTFWKPAEGSAHHEDWLERAWKMASASLAGIRPMNELEGMIAGQIVAAHAASMECYRRAALSEQTFDGRESNLRHAAKASRTFVTLVESLQKLRGESGKQTMHVHHHNTDARTQVAAKQAVVNVGDQGGGETKNSTQPHEPEAITHEPTETIDFGEALRCKEPCRETVQGTGNEGQETVQTSWREKPGGA